MTFMYYILHKIVPFIFPPFHVLFPHSWPESVCVRLWPHIYWGTQAVVKQFLAPNETWNQI